MNEQYKQDFLRAGAIAKEVRAYGKSLIKKGVSYNHVTQQIYQKISELGAIAAFPPQLALNDVAAHFLPLPGSDIIFSNELIKLDIGVCYKGAIGDCAVTIDLSGKYQPLIDATEAALLNAEKSIKVGLPIREIGKIIETTITSHGFKPIKNLSGHGLGHYRVHTSPTIPNYDDRSKTIIKPGMTFAIEPFGTTGRGLIYEGKNPTIFSLIKEKPLKSDFAKLLLTKIKSFKGLPFSMHELISPELPFMQTQMALSELLGLEIIAGYPPLIEEAHGMVVQAENSVLVDNKGNVFVTTR